MKVDVLEPKRTVYFELKRPNNFYRQVYILYPMNIIVNFLFRDRVLFLKDPVLQINRTLAVVETRWTVQFDQ